MRKDFWEKVVYIEDRWDREKQRIICLKSLDKWMAEQRLVGDKEIQNLLRVCEKKT